MEAHRANRDGTMWYRFAQMYGQWDFYVASSYFCRARGASKEPGCRQSSLMLISQGGGERWHQCRRVCHKWAVNVVNGWEYLKTDSSKRPWV